MKRSILAALLLQILCIDCIAQTPEVTIDSDDPHRIGLGTAYSFIQTRDEAGSPLMYSGHGVPINLFYEYRGERSRHRVNIGYIKTGINGGTLSSEVTEYQADGNVVSHTTDYSYRALQYGYAHRIGTLLDDRLTLFLGGVWDNLLFFRYHAYGSREVDQRDPDLLTWEGLFSINASIAGELTIDDEQLLALSIHTPLVAFVARPRYAIQEDELVKISLDNFSQLNTGRSRFVTIDKLAQVSAGLTYTCRLSSLFDLRLFYQFMFYRYGQPRVTSSAFNSLGAALLYRF